MAYSITPISTTVSEGVGSITFTVTRTSTSLAETVYFSTLQNLGFTNNGDYSGHLNTPLIFGTGVSTRTITVNITNDSIIEGTESFSVLLDTASGTVLDTSTFTITDNDTVAPSTFSMTPASTTVSEGVGSVTFTITRSSGAAAETVYFSTLQNQGSSNNSDYTGIANQAVSFAAGVTSRTVTVNITNDSVVEGTETFGAVIERTVGGTVLDTSTFTITDNDTVTPPTGPWTRPVGFAHLPIAGSPVVTQGFGGDFSHDSADGTRQYYWVDFAATSGTPIRAMGNGVVIGIRTGSFQGDTAQGQFGNYVTVRHDGGVIATYAHLSTVNVSLNQAVVGGSTILGATGLTGFIQGPHLHVSLGTTTTGSGSLLRAAVADDVNQTGSPAFFISHFSSTAETGGFVNVADPSTLRSTDIFGTAIAMAGGSPAANIYQDELYGSAANNRIFAGSGNDRLLGYGGNDTLVGGTGNDTIDRGNGNDVLVGGAGRDVLNGGTGTDYADYRLSTGITLALDGSLVATGDALGDTLTSIEVILGSRTARDVIVGNSSANFLYGYGGNDELNGQAGNDLLRGGVGTDNLTGGTGQDRFSYVTRNEGGDIITDFIAADDTFVFHSTGFGNLPLGVLAASSFRSQNSNAAVDNNDFFIFRTTDQTLWFDPDGNGAQAAILIADMQAGATMTAADILLI